MNCNSKHGNIDSFLPMGSKKEETKKINVKNKRKQFSKLFSYRATASKMELVFAAIPESGWKRSHRCHKPKSSKWRLCGFTLEKNWGNMRAKSCNAIGDGSIWTASSAFFSPLFAFNSNIKKNQNKKISHQNDLLIQPVIFFCVNQLTRICRRLLRGSNLIPPPPSLVTGPAHTWLVACT